MDRTTPIILHSFAPVPSEEGGLGGFDWAYEGTPSETQIREQFALDADTTHHDFTPTHRHRLLRLQVPIEHSTDGVSDFIERELLDYIESGVFDSIPEILQGIFIPEGSAL